MGPHLGVGTARVRRAADFGRVPLCWRELFVSVLAGRVLERACHCLHLSGGRSLAFALVTQRRLNDDAECVDRHVQALTKEMVETQHNSNGMIS